MIKTKKPPSLTSCIRFHEAGHAIAAYRLGGTIECVGAKGRAAHIRLPNRQWVEHEGICLTHWFSDFDRLSYPLHWNAPGFDELIKDIAVMMGGIWAHKHYAGISFEEATEMGGYGDMVAINQILGWMPPNIRECAKDLARAVCRETLRTPKNWYLVESLAEHLKKHPVVSGKEAHDFLWTEKTLWELDKLIKQIPDDSAFWNDRHDPS